MSADAVVVAARGDGRVDLEFAARTPCAGCAGTCLWKRLTASRIDGLPSPRALAPGTVVAVELPERFVLLGSLLLHGAPLAALIVGAALGAAVIGGDLGTLTGAVVAVAAAIAMLGRLRRQLERATLHHLVIRPKP